MRYFKYLLKQSASKSADTVFKLCGCKLVRYPIYFIIKNILLKTYLNPVSLLLIYFFDTVILV